MAGDPTFELTWTLVRKHKFKSHPFVLEGLADKEVFGGKEPPLTLVSSSGFC